MTVIIITVKIDQKKIIIDIMAKVKLLDQFLPLIFFIFYFYFFPIFMTSYFIIFCFSSLIFIYDIMIYQIMHSVKLLQALHLKAIFKNN